MKTLQEEINGYLFYCKEQRRLDDKTVRAYQVDLEQFLSYLQKYGYIVSKDILNLYIISLHQKYKQKTVKRKIASLKAFYAYLEREEITENNPMRKVRTQFREEKPLPKTIPLEVIEQLLEYMYTKQRQNGLTAFQKKILARDIAIIELLFATGIRITELCNLTKERFNLKTGVLCIKGKGAKERYLQVGNHIVLKQIERYSLLWEKEINNNIYFFYNYQGEKYSEQSARHMINKYVDEADIHMHITPHMFRHSFATLLLEEDVDIRYIQKMLGHSSIITTQIYTEVALKKQLEILQNKHPRLRMKINSEKSG